MRMLPASTCSPPKRFTPSRLEWESRPFLVLPPAFLCAMCASARADVRHLDFGERLAVVLLAQVVLAPAELDHRYLGALAVANHGGDHFAPHDQRITELDAGTLADEQDLAELDRGAGLGVELLDTQHAVFGDAILLSAGGDHCVHRLEGERGSGERPRILLAPLRRVKRLLHGSTRPRFLRLAPFSGPSMTFDPFSAAPVSDRMRGRARGPFDNDIGRNTRARPAGPRFRRPGDPRAPEERGPAGGPDRRPHHRRRRQAAAPTPRRTGWPCLRAPASRSHRSGRV